MSRSASVLAVLVFAAAAGACPELPAVLDGPSFFEYYLGASNTNAALGNGGLTATYSRCGELTGLRWPGPGGRDQLSYLTTNDRRHLRLGALDDMGAFAGLAYETDSGGRAFTWLRDEPWTHTQRYDGDDSGVLVTDMVNPVLGLEVTSQHFVLPDRSVLVSHFDVQRRRDSPVRRAWLVFYENFNPTLTRIPFYPVGDWLLDFENDFAVVYDRRARGLLHFVPADGGDAVHLEDVLGKPARSRGAFHRRVGRLVARLTGPGVYVAAGFRGRPDGFQAGYDDAPMCLHQTEVANRAIDLFALPPALDESIRARFVCDRAVTHPGGPLGACRERAGWRHEAQSAFADAEDGQLSGSAAAGCQANAALSRRLRFRNGRAAETVYVAVGGTRHEAYRLLRGARARSPRAQRRATDAWWARFLSTAHLPATDDPLITAFAKRSLITFRTAADEASGAIVASVATQPPYAFDWPRDGAFVNYALELGGYRDLVSRHNRFYARVQRKTVTSWSELYPFPPCDPANPVYPTCIPAGTFETNYYADPVEAMPGYLVSFEIDEAGLATWTMADHVHQLADPAERAAYLADVCPAIRLAADGLAACRDAASGLQCASNEDDSTLLTQGLQGAVTVLLALESAAGVAGDCGFAEEAAAWRARAEELRGAILARFQQAGPPARFSGGRPGERASWVIWPAAVLPPDDPRLLEHAEYLRQTRLAPLLGRSILWGSYDAEPLLARAQLFRQLGDVAGLAEAQEHVRFLVRELTTEGTLHVGESYGRLFRDRTADGVFPDYLPLNDVPHTWAHAYLYAAAMVAFGSR